MQQSCLFFRNITCIDHAYIDNDGLARGRSLHLDVYLYGPVEPEENVVIDFSKAKKFMKSAIDDHENGFDHKLWVPEEKFQLERNPISGDLTLETWNLKITAKSDCFVYISGNPESMTDVARNISMYLTRCLREKFGPNVWAEAKVDFVAFADDNAVFFDYVHGLKKSSSYGCQNIAHGHTSFIEFDSFKPEYAKWWDENKDLLVSFLNPQNKPLVFIQDENNIDYNTCNYRSRDRGSMFAQFSPAHNVVVLETETTVEHLAEWIAKLPFFDPIRGKGCNLLVSEGLQKGAVVLI